MAEWNDWSKHYRWRNRQGLGISLDGADFSDERFLENVNLGGASLIGSLFHQAHLKGANLVGAHLDSADFREAHLDSADFRIAHLEKSSFGSAHLNSAIFQGAYLEGADFTLAHLDSANFMRAHLRESQFLLANLYAAQFMAGHLEGANFEDAYLKCSDFREAHLEGAFFVGARLEGADFSYSLVDGKTLIFDCTIDDKTNFTGVGLSSARIEPRIKCRLEKNIRRMQWEKWYKEHRFAQWFVRPFWWISDYGTNTPRILGIFILMIAFFAICYGIIDCNTPHIFKKIDFNTAGLWELQLLCFATATMVTLGFGGVNVAVIPDSPWWSALALIVVTLNLLTGYFLLAVLVTRLGILFQSQGPD